MQHQECFLQVLFAPREEFPLAENIQYLRIILIICIWHIKEQMIEVGVDIQSICFCSFDNAVYRSTGRSFLRCIRKNWLFSNTPRGANASAIIYSIIETAKENNLNPFEYLTYLFERLPNEDIDDMSVLDLLLPWSEALPERCKVQNH